MAKQESHIADSINRRFFVAVDYLVTMGRVHSLEVLCEKLGLHSPRYREMRLTYGITPNPKSKPSRYKNIEMDAIYFLCIEYSISAEWLMLGRGKMFKDETKRKI
ncbi:MAG: hypothetical protein LBS01_04405 [Prevotellaceae bacterium]|jgi:hypothetical protein|nr:hypothetical protein [Prevotellaceae bacterium]